MLQQLRNPYWMKWGMWVVLGLTIPSFVALYGFSDLGRSGGGPVAMGTLATVRYDGKKHELGRNEMLAARGDAAAYYQSIAAAVVGPNQVMGLQREIYEALGTSPRAFAPFAVAEIPLQRRLHDLGIRVTDQQVSDYLRQSGVTRENFAQRFGNRSQYEVAASIRSQLQTEAAERTVNSIARTSLLELWQEYLLREEQLTVSYARVPVEADPLLEITEAELQAKYDELVAAQSPIVLEAERRVYEYISLRLPPRTMPNPTEEQILAAYEAASASDPQFAAEPGFRVRQILIAPDSETTAEAALSRAQIAVQLLQGGANFANVANEFSRDLRNMAFDDPDTSPTLRGGLLPYMLRGDEVDAWGEDYIAFLRSARVGDTSDVLNTPQGFAVVRVEEIVSDSKKPLEAVRQILVGRLRQELQAAANTEREALTRENLTRARAARRSETTLAGIARNLDAQTQTTSPTLSTSTFIAGIGNLARDADVLRRMRVNRVSEPLTNANGDIVILRIAEVIPPTNRPIDTIRTRLEQQVRTDRAAAEALATAEALKTLLMTNPDDSLTSAAAELSVQAGMIDAFGRQSVPPVLASSPEAANVLISARKGDTFILRGGTPDLPLEYIVVRVENVSEPSRLDFMRSMQDLEQDLLGAKRRGYVEDFRRDANRRLQVTFNPDFIGEEPTASR